MKQETKLSFSVSANEDGWMLKDVIADRGVGRGLLRRTVPMQAQGGGVFLNGSLSFISCRVRAGDIITLVLADEATALPPEPMDLNIVHEDDYFIAINKPANMAVHPTGKYQQGTLGNGLAHLWAQRGLNRKIRLVHRLDLDTSGLLLVAKDPYSHQILIRQLRQKSMRRHYYALTCGTPAPQRGIIRAPIGRPTADHGAGHGLRRVVVNGGKPSETCYRLVGVYGQERWALVAVEPLTGRTHQIRVHLAHIGTPILGDQIYGQPSRFIQRQALHACKIEFTHPRSGKEMVVTAPLPEDMQLLLTDAGQRN